MDPPFRRERVPRVPPRCPRTTRRRLARTRLVSSSTPLTVISSPRRLAKSNQQDAIMAPPGANGQAIEATLGSTRSHEQEARNACRRHPPVQPRPPPLSSSPAGARRCGSRPTSKRVYGRRRATPATAPTSSRGASVPARPRRSASSRHVATTRSQDISSGALSTRLVSMATCCSSARPKAIRDSERRADRDDARPPGRRHRPRLHVYAEGAVPRPCSTARPCCSTPSRPTLDDPLRPPGRGAGRPRRRRVLLDSIYTDGIHLIGAGPNPRRVPKDSVAAVQRLHGSARHCMQQGLSSAGAFRPGLATRARVQGHPATAPDGQRLRL